MPKGFRKLRIGKAEDDDILRQAEESIKRLEKQGFGKLEKAAPPSAPPAAPAESDEDRIRRRLEMERKLGVKRGRGAWQ